MSRFAPVRTLLVALVGVVAATGCTTMSHPPERVWPAETPGSYPGRTPTTMNGEWWFPSMIGPKEIPPLGGNKGTLFFAGAKPKVEKGKVERVVYDVTYRDQDVRVERLIFPAITFDHQSAKLDEQAQHQVKQAASSIERARGYNVVVEGHSDKTEDAAGKWDSKRAATVRDALVNLGIVGDRLTTTAMGASQPLSKADTDMGRRLNRRVAFQLIPANLDLNPQPPEDEPMPKVGPDQEVVTVRKPVTVTRPRLVFVDRLVFPNILFDYDKSNLRPESQVRVDRAAEAIKALDSVEQVTVEGHCDWIGSHTYNDALSLRRAASVKDRLIEDGVPGQEIETVGRGKRQPIATNETPEGRQLNRRVEFRIEYEK